MLKVSFDTFDWHMLKVSFDICWKYSEYIVTIVSFQVSFLCLPSIWSIGEPYHLQFCHFFCDPGRALRTILCQHFFSATWCYYVSFDFICHSLGMFLLFEGGGVRVQLVMIEICGAYIKLIKYIKKQTVPLT